MVIAPCSRMGPVTDDERNGLINRSPLYGKYEDDVDRESAFEMLQKGVQATTESQDAPAAKGQSVAVDDGILVTPEELRILTSHLRALGR